MMNKKNDPKSFFICLFIFLIGFAVIPNELIGAYICVVSAVTIFYFDDSGIRINIVKKLPKDFPFYKALSRKKRKIDKLTECYKTATFISLLLIIPFSPIAFIFVGLAILFTSLSIVRYIKHNEEIYFAPQKNRAFSTTELTIGVPATIFAMTAENQTFNTWFFVLSVGMVLVFIVPFLIKTTEYRKKKSVLFLFILFITLFSVGTISVVNKAFDFGERETYRVEITDKTEYHGKTTDYVLVLSPWDEFEYEVSISVSKEKYEEYRIGDSVNII